MFPLLSALLLVPSAAPAGPHWLYVGTYTDAKSKGIYRFTFDPATGKLADAELAAETPSPSFLAIHPTGKFLFAVNEVGQFMGQKDGGVSSFALDPATGKLTPLNSQVSHGVAPCHIVADKAGKHVLVANYSGGSVAVLPVGSDGHLAPASSVIKHSGSSVNKQRQQAPHAHSINLDAANRFAVVADLGLDKVLVYRFDPAAGTLTPNDPPATATAPGAGPRHFAFHPDGKRGYVINELALTVTAFAYDPEKGTLTPGQTLSTLPDGANRKGASTAEVVVHPNGKFLYGSNRGHDTIASFAIDATTGELTPTGHQGEGVKTPRNFVIDPSGKFLLVANQGAASIVVFAIDPMTGKLTPTGTKVEVPNPVCLRFAQK